LRPRYVDRIVGRVQPGRLHTFLTDTATSVRDTKQCCGIPTGGSSAPRADEGLYSIQLMWPRRQMLRSAGLELGLACGRKAYGDACLASPHARCLGKDLLADGKRLGSRHRLHQLA
jgi:hypothetical protein